MFFQICLLTAGLQLGRMLIQRLQAADSESDDPAPPVDDRPAARDAQAVAPAPAQSAAVSDQSAPATEDADAQFQLALSVAATTLVTRWLAPQLTYLGGVALLYGSLPMLRRAGQQITGQGRVGSDTLHSVGLVAGVAARQFPAFAALSLLDSATLKLRADRARAAQRSLADALSRRAVQVWACRDGIDVEVALDAVQAGDVLVVTAGDLIPVDGVVVLGRAQIQPPPSATASAALHTGVGDFVASGSAVIDGRIHLCVQQGRVWRAPTALAQLAGGSDGWIQTVEAESEHTADAAARSLLLLSALSLSILPPDSTQALLSANSVDNLRWSRPLALLTHLRAAFDQDVILQDARALARLAEVDTVVFGGTGVLTQGTARVVDVHGLAGHSDAAVLSYAAMAEQQQHHPWARAIVAAAQQRGLTGMRPDDVEQPFGGGLRATSQGVSVAVGSRRFLQAGGAAFPPALADIEAAIAARDHAGVYVARQGAVIGLIELACAPHPQAAAVLAALRARGLSLALVTGDPCGPLPAAAHRPQLAPYIVGADTADKIQLLQALRDQGRRVCYVGHSLGSACVHDHAHLFVSFADAAAALQARAHVVLPREGLGRIPQLFALSDHFRRSEDRIHLSMTLPLALAVGGVLAVRFTANMVGALQLGSVAAGTWFAAVPPALSDEAM